MFTGIITNLGQLQKRENSRFVFQADEKFCDKIDHGTSIAVNGVCLTATSKSPNTFTVEIMPETQKRANLHSLRQTDLVNLELPATPSSLLSGHIVQGHIDTSSKIIDIKEEGNSHIFTFFLPSKFSKYIIEKGSITVNGISLTVIDVNKTSFNVGIIPHTYKNTMLHIAKKGDFVNLEFDVLAKYVEKLIC